MIIAKNFSGERGGMMEPILKLPVTYDGQEYIFDADENVVAEIRGWGELSNKYGEEKATEIQNARAEFIVSAINKTAECYAKVMVIESQLASANKENIALKKRIMFLRAKRSQLNAECEIQADKLSVANKELEVYKLALDMAVEDVNEYVRLDPDPTYMNAEVYLSYAISNRAREQIAKEQKP